MKRYICLCGQQFKTKIETDNHIDWYIGTDQDGAHVVFKRKFWAYSLDKFMALDHIYLLCLIAGTCMSNIFLKHFNFSQKETWIWSFCNGLIMARIFSHDD